MATSIVPETSSSNKSLAFIRWLEQVKAIHGDKYRYDLVVYVKSSLKVKIICNKCGEIFSQRPHNHLQGAGCPTCGKNASTNSRLGCKDDFVRKAKTIHGEKYGYERSVYVTSRVKLEIHCRTCGQMFWQKPSNHLAGQGCTACKNKARGISRRIGSDAFLKRAIKVHGEKYDYAEAKPSTTTEKIRIRCLSCDRVFQQVVGDHLRGCGCPACSRSHGSELIEKILTKLSIAFDTEKAFEGCKYAQSLYFDFFLPEYNLCIEYQGQQHYMAIRAWGGEKAFLLQQYRDQIKRDFCKKTGIKLLEIRYDCKDVEQEILRSIGQI